MSKTTKKKETLCLWLLLLIPLFDWASTLLNPLKPVSTRKYRPIESDALSAKFPPYFKSNQKPEILIVGSSLPMCAFTLPDQTLRRAAEKGIDHMPILMSYSRAEEFQKALKDKLKIEGEVSNLTCAGCMVSDTYTLLKRLIEANRAPLMVLYGIAPRDFADNMMPKIGESPLCLALADWSGKLSKPQPTASEYLSFYIGKYSNFYKTRNRYRNAFTEIAADNLGRPISLYAASHPETAGSENSINTKSLKENVIAAPKVDKAPIDHDLELYKTRYNPLSLDRLNTEKVSLNKLVELCQSNKITLLIIEMPLTERNRNLMPADLVVSYQTAIANASENKVVKVIDFFTPDYFTPPDFSDSAHLNIVGSAKFQNLLVKEMKRREIRPCVTF